ncbi:MAG: MoaD/ThiS family protein [Rhodanobacteraceae bacterium]|nr:MoaD/ThiS family protein [Rhodanobacteraceae bacterium]
MATVVLAPALSRWLDPAGTSASERSVELAGADVQALLDALFLQYPVLRGYVQDEHGALRHHVAVFVDGSPLRDKSALHTPVQRNLYLVQALSGG